MIDIVIPFLGGKSESMELRFALRSIEKHLSGVRDIWIIGQPPTWLRGCRVMDYQDDPSQQKHEFNIFSKMKLACENPEISENFMRFDDDHIIMANYVASDFPYYTHRSLMQGAQANVSSYRMTMISTMKLLEKRGLALRDFDCHCPILYNKDAFVSAFEGVVWRDYGFAVKSVYCNSLGIEGEKCEDLKLIVRRDVRKMARLVAGRQWFSTGTSGREMEVFLAGLFPRASRYEK